MFMIPKLTLFCAQINKLYFLVQMKNFLISCVISFLYFILKSQNKYVEENNFGLWKYFQLWFNDSLLADNRKCNKILWFNIHTFQVWIYVITHTCCLVIFVVGTLKMICVVFRKIENREMFIATLYDSGWVIFMMKKFIYIQNKNHIILIQWHYLMIKIIIFLTKNKISWMSLDIFFFSDTSKDVII